jgi:hypothetical protein
MDEITKPPQLRVFGELCDLLRLVAESVSEKLDERLATLSSVFAPILFRQAPDAEDVIRSPRTKRRAEATEQRIFQFVVKYSQKIFNAPENDL